MFSESVNLVLGQRTWKEKLQDIKDSFSRVWTSTTDAKCHKLVYVLPSLLKLSSAFDSPFSLLQLPTFFVTLRKFKIRAIMFSFYKSISFKSISLVNPGFTFAYCSQMQDVLSIGMISLVGWFLRQPLFA